jgi:MSHA pilin protein MshC
MNKAQGFSLLELVITLVIVGILAVTVIPKLLGTSTFASYAVRDQLITQLRLAQIRALHDNSNCYSVLITSTQYGIPFVTKCAATFDPSDDPVDIESGVTVTIGGAANVDVQFDNMGRPVNGDCDGGCDVIISGEESLTVRVESEGYIHAL